jgi:hypothetical protein
MKQWIRYYNDERLHRALYYLPPDDVFFGRMGIPPRCLKTKNLTKTILVPLECGANEVRDENQTGDFQSALPALSKGGEKRQGEDP